MFTIAVSSIVYQSIINSDPNNYSTINTALLQCIQLEKPDYAVITFDLLIWLKAVDLILRQRMPIISRLGGFHLLKSYLATFGVILATADSIPMTKRFRSKIKNVITQLDKAGRTPLLWRLYHYMVDTIKIFIGAERMDEFTLYLVLQIGCFTFAAARHHNYSKEARLYDENT